MSNARNSKDAKRLTKLYGTRERGVGHQRHGPVGVIRNRRGYTAQNLALGLRVVQVAHLHELLSNLHLHRFIAGTQHPLSLQVPALVGQ